MYTCQTKLPLDHGRDQLQSIAYHPSSISTHLPKEKKNYYAHPKENEYQNLEMIFSSLHSFHFCDEFSFLLAHLFSVKERSNPFVKQTQGWAAACLVNFAVWTASTDLLLHAYWTLIEWRERNAPTCNSSGVKLVVPCSAPPHLN